MWSCGLVYLVLDMIKNKVFLPILLLWLFLMSSHEAVAADYYVDITNKTGFTIFYVYVSPGKSKSWEEDVLGSNVLSNGETYRITLRGYKSSIFDIRLVDEDGDSYTFWNVDVSIQDIVATLADLDT
jgi:hypothetical protein